MRAKNFLNSFTTLRLSPGTRAYYDR